MIDIILAFLSPSGELLTLIGASILVLTMLMAGFLRGFVGFGSALIIVMVVSTILGPLFAVPVATLTGIPTAVQLLPVAYRYSEKAFVLPFGISAIIVAPFGTWILVNAAPGLMRISISLFVLVAVIFLYRGWRSCDPIARVVLIGFGAFSGLVQGAAGVGGPPAVALALARPGLVERQRANVIGAVTCLIVASLFPLAFYGLFTVDVMLMSLVLFPIYSFGTWCGTRYFSSKGQQHFRNTALAILGVIGLVTLGLAIKDYLALP